MNNSISIEQLATTIFVLVDDWYQTIQPLYFTGKRGRKPVFSDSEVITLMLLMDYVPFPSETQFLGFIKANYLDLFPNLLDQSQFNRRSRQLANLVEKLRQHWAIKLGVGNQQEFLIDTKPVPVLGYKRDKRKSDFLATADYGVCSSRNMKYFGYKLVMLSTLNGIPAVYELVPANTDERVAADEVLDHVYGSNILGDKGFIGEFWQSEHNHRNGNKVFTPKRSNQEKQNPKLVDIRLNSIRERIEGVFNELQNTGRNLERLLRKKVSGLKAHVISIVASHALKLILRRDFQIDVQTFSRIN